MIGKIRPTPLEIEEKIRTTFLEENQGLSPQDIRPQAKIIDDLGIDSVNLLQIIFSLEVFYGIKIKDEDFIYENFETVDRMVRFFTLQLE